MGEQKGVVIAPKLRQLKGERGLSWPQVAQGTGIGERHLMRLADPRFGAYPQTVKRVAEFFEIDPVEFYREQ